ncbi:hypothetical protein D3C87_1760880 [compost metagenome]
MRQAVRAGLFGIGQLNAIQAPITQQLAEARQVFRRGDDEDLAHACKHEHRQRVEDHRLVVDRQHLLGDAEGQWMQARARATGKNDAFTI